MTWVGASTSCALLAFTAGLFVHEPAAAAASVFGRKSAGVRNHTEGAIKAHLKLFPGIEHHNISPYIYGQFIEHVGGCIYDGIWVGEDSEIENVGGIRLDTVRALKKIEVPVVRWPGGLFADNYRKNILVAQCG